MRVYLPDVHDDPVLNRGHYMFYRYEGTIYLGELCEADKSTSGTREGEFNISEEDERDFFFHLHVIIDAYFSKFAYDSWDVALKELKLRNIQASMSRCKVSKYVFIEESHDGKRYHWKFFLSDGSEHRKVGVVNSPYQDFGFTLIELRDQLKIMFPEVMGIRDIKHFKKLRWFYQVLTGRS